MVPSAYVVDGTAPGGSEHAYDGLVDPRDAQGADATSSIPASFSARRLQLYLDGSRPDLRVSDLLVGQGFAPSPSVQTSSVKQRLPPPPSLNTADLSSNSFLPPPAPSSASASAVSPRHPFHLHQRGPSGSGVHTTPTTPYTEGYAPYPSEPSPLPPFGSPSLVPSHTPFERSSYDPMSRLMTPATSSRMYLDRGGLVGIGELASRMAAGPPTTELPQHTHDIPPVPDWHVSRPDLAPISPPPQQHPRQSAEAPVQHSSWATTTPVRKAPRSQTSHEERYPRPAPPNGLARRHRRDTSADSRAQPPNLPSQRSSIASGFMFDPHLGATGVNSSMANSAQSPPPLPPSVPAQPSLPLPNERSTTSSDPTDPPSGSSLGLDLDLDVVADFQASFANFLQDHSEREKERARTSRHIPAHVEVLPPMPTNFSSPSSANFAVPSRTSSRPASNVRDDTMISTGNTPRRSVVLPALPPKLPTTPTRSRRKTPEPLSRNSSIEGLRRTASGRNRSRGTSAANPDESLPSSTGNGNITSNAPTSSRKHTPNASLAQSLLRGEYEDYSMPQSVSLSASAHSRSGSGGAYYPSPPPAVGTPNKKGRRVSGLSNLGDPAAVDALRKLDGISPARGVRTSSFNVRNEPDAPPTPQRGSSSEDLRSVVEEVPNRKRFSGHLGRVETSSIPPVPPLPRDFEGKPLVHSAKPDTTSPNLGSGSGVFPLPTAANEQPAGRDPPPSAWRGPVAHEEEGAKHARMAVPATAPPSSSTPISAASPTSSSALPSSRRRSDHFLGTTLVTGRSSGDSYLTPTMAQSPIMASPHNVSVSPRIPSRTTQFLTPSRPNPDLAPPLTAPTMGPVPTYPPSPSQAQASRLPQPSSGPSCTTGLSAPQSSRRSSSGAFLASVSSAGQKPKKSGSVTTPTTMIPPTLAPMPPAMSSDGSSGSKPRHESRTSLGHKFSLSSISQAFRSPSSTGSRERDRRKDSSVPVPIPALPAGVSEYSCGSSRPFALRRASLAPAGRDTPKGSKSKRMSVLPIKFPRGKHSNNNDDPPLTPNQDSSFALASPAIHEPAYAEDPYILPPDCKRSDLTTSASLSAQLSPSMVTSVSNSFTNASTSTIFSGSGSFTGPVVPSNLSTTVPAYSAWPTNPHGATPTDDRGSTPKSLRTPTFFRRSIGRKVTQDGDEDDGATTPGRSSKLKNLWPSSSSSSTRWSTLPFNIPPVPARAPPMLNNEPNSPATPQVQEHTRRISLSRKLSNSTMSPRARTTTLPGTIKAPPAPVRDIKELPLAPHAPHAPEKRSSLQSTRPVGPSVPQEPQRFEPIPPVSITSSRVPSHAPSQPASSVQVPAASVPTNAASTTKDQELTDWADQAPGSQPTSSKRRPLSLVAAPNAELPLTKDSPATSGTQHTRHILPTAPVPSAGSADGTVDDCTAADSSFAPPVVSPPIVSILNACAVAKTPAETDAVMQRVRTLFYQPPVPLSAAEHNILHGLLIRAAEMEQGTATDDMSLVQVPAVVDASSAADAYQQPMAKLPDPSPTAYKRSSLPPMMPTTVQDEGPLLAPLGARRSPRPTSTEIARDHMEDKVLGDEEMKTNIERYQARKLSQGVKQADLDRQFEFPLPEPASREYSVRQAEVIFGNRLCNYEIHELIDTMKGKKIYYAGTTRKHIAHVSRPEFNYGYDDDRGDYKVVLRDHLAYRYEVVQCLGRGSFGQVLKCKDHKTGKWVAIKLIRNKQRFHHQALVETKILEQLVEWDPEDKFNVVHMVESFYFRNHLCIAMELMSMNLYELIKCNSFNGCSVRLIRRFTMQALNALILMVEHEVVHCDLKPENILLVNPRKCDLKVIDFGSSCFKDQKIYTYIQSRFYRSPEVILGISYGLEIDMWSLGCIVAEMYTGYPLFPGENEQEQLACIMEIFGQPPSYLLEQASRASVFFDSHSRPRHFVNSKGKTRKPGSKSLQHSLAKCQDELFIDFIARCLEWDPAHRLTPAQAQHHPWIQHVYPKTSAKRVSSRRKTITASAPPSAAVGTSVSAPVSAAPPPPLPAPTSIPPALHPHQAAQPSHGSQPVSWVGSGQSSAAANRLGSVPMSSQGTNLARTATGMTSPPSARSSGMGTNLKHSGHGVAQDIGVSPASRVPAAVPSAPPTQSVPSPAVSMTKDMDSMMSLLQRFPQPETTEGPTSSLPPGAI